MTRYSFWGLLLVAVGLLPTQTAQAGGPAYSAATNYVLRCAGCHRTDGAGAAEQGIPPFPGLVDTFYLDPEGRRYLLHVPGVSASGLNSAEIADVLNYVAKRWGREPARLPGFTEAEVQQLRAEPVDDLVVFRRHLAERYRAAGVKLAPYPWP